MRILAMGNIDGVCSLRLLEEKTHYEVIILNMATRDQIFIESFGEEQEALDFFKHCAKTFGLQDND